MKITREENLITIISENDFDAKEILESGQVFSFYCTSPDSFVVISGSRFATVSVFGEKTVIKTTDPDYFYNYFDLDTDYKKIKREILLSSPEFSKFFYGGNSIRILRQDPVQTILSFIVSANNNIKRIMGFLTNMSRLYGTKLECGFYSFPTLSQLSEVSEKDFKNLKAGYRSSYLVDTIRTLQQPEFSAENLQKLDTKTLKTRLISLRGIGPKVADCILLFAFARFDVFPVDTWIRKSFALFSNEQKTDKQIENFFLSLFGKNAGYAQQYLYNYMLHKFHD